MTTRFAIALPNGKPVTADYPTAAEAWRELIADLPTDPDAARTLTLKWVGKGYRVIDRGQGT